MRPGRGGRLKRRCWSLWVACAADVGHSPVVDVHRANCVEARREGSARGSAEHWGGEEQKQREKGGGEGEGKEEADPSGCCCG